MYKDFFIRVNADKQGNNTVEAYGPTHNSTIPLNFEYPGPESGKPSAFENFQNHDDKYAERVGVDLFHAIFPEDIREVWTRSEQALPNAKDQIRIKLAVRAPLLSEWPWELLRDPGAALFFSQRANYSVVRFIDSNKPIALMNRIAKIRILFIYAQPTGSGQLDKRQSIESIRKNCDPAWEVVELDPPTKDALRQKLREDFQIIHFHGHGHFERDQEKERGYLLLCDDKNAPDILTDEELAGYLDGKNIRLVVLNGCSTATGSEFIPLAGVARCIARASSIPAVVAMQAPVREEVAIEFTNRFYHELSSGMAIDWAVLEGRYAIHSLTTKTAPPCPPLSWAIPVLFMRSSDGMIFKSLDERTNDSAIHLDQIKKRAETSYMKDLADGLKAHWSNAMSVSPDRKTPGVAMEHWREPEIVYGRREDMRVIWEFLDPYRRRLLILSSDEGAGATELLQTGIVARLIADGEFAFYLNMRDDDPGTQLKQLFVPKNTRTRSYLLGLPLEDFLEKLAKLIPADRRIVFVLDNFDEFLNRGDSAAREKFLNELKECLDAKSLRVQWILSVRKHKVTSQQLDELESDLAGHKKSFLLSCLNREQITQIAEGLAWRAGKVLDTARLEEIVNRAVNDGYSSSFIRAEIDQLPQIEHPPRPDKPEGDREQPSPKLIVAIAGAAVWSILLLISIIIFPTDGGLILEWFVLLNGVGIAAVLVGIMIRKKMFHRLPCLIPFNLFHARGWKYASPESPCAIIYFCKREGCDFREPSNQHALGAPIPDPNNNCKLTRHCNCGYIQLEKHLWGKEKDKHNWSEPFTDKKNNCKITRKCDHCGHTRIEKDWRGKDKGNHVLSEWRHIENCIQEQHCSQCDYRKEKQFPHIWENAWRHIENCIHEHDCSRCGHREKKQFNHIWRQPTHLGHCWYEHYCSICNWREEFQSPHQYKQDYAASQTGVNCDVVATCIKCGDQTIWKDQHKSGDGECDWIRHPTDNQILIKRCRHCGKELGTKSA